MTTYMTGYSGKTMTRDQLLQWSVWKRFEPEYARRLLALMDEVIAAGKPIGVGGGWRSTESQRSLFLSRYVVEDDNDLTGDVFWEGKYWERKPGVAPAAPPGVSYHEPCTPEGYCLAVDLVGDVKFAATLANKHNLVHFGNINGEWWHYQPAEIPHSRRQFTASMVPLKKFPTEPSVPVPAPPKPVVVVPAPTLRLVVPVNMSGKEVATLQQVMAFWNWYGYKDATGKWVDYKCDGWFGPRTREGVVAMQKALNTTQDGVYGPVTAAKYKAFAEYMASVAK